MPPYSLQVRLPYDSGLPSDVAINVWQCIADDDAAAATFVGRVVDFYLAVDDVYSSLLDNGANKAGWKLYNMFDDPPRVPVFEGNFTLAGATGTPLPPEVAICLSYTRTIQSGVVRARRRGRLYLGPLETSTVASDGRVDATTQDLIRDSAQTLLDASNAATDWAWAQHSAAEDDWGTIVSGYVDNEFDTQRRRGRIANTRLAFG